MTRDAIFDRCTPVGLALWVVLFAGCSVRSGDQGLPGQDNLSFIWKDATGAVVSESRALLYRDDAGNLWPLNPETAEIVWQQGDASALWLENEDCTGTAYTAQWPPRRVIRLWGETTYRVRADMQQTEDAITRSHRNPIGDCVATGAVQQRLLPVAALSAPLPEPSLPFVPPLRLEPR